MLGNFLIYLKYVIFSNGTILSDKNKNEDQCLCGKSTVTITIFFLLISEALGGF